MEIKNAPVQEQVKEMDTVPGLSRRRFFQLAGGITGAGLLLEACSRGKSTDTFVGSGDTGLLNYIYIIQQLEAAFYTQAVATPYYGLSISESQLLTDTRDQEIAHCEYLKALLGKDAVPAISTNFSAVTFADRASVLKYAAIFEDIAVSAINGCVHYFTNTDYVYALAKMASVEARHSAYYRDLLTNGTFADSSIIDAYGLDQAGVPSIVFANVLNYVHTSFDSSKIA